MRALVTCHAQADGDALGSLAAASVLWPGATLVWPQCSDRELQRLVEDKCFGERWLPGLVRAGTLDPATPFDVLVLVDTAKRARVAGAVQPWLDAGLPVVVVDHHPPDAEADVTPVHARWTHLWGSCSALLVAMLACGVDPMRPSPLEQELPSKAGTPFVAERMTREVATLILYGIHCDTISFTTAATTAADLLAASLVVQLAHPVRPFLALAPAVDADVLAQLQGSCQIHHMAGVVSGAPCILQ